MVVREIMCSYYMSMIEGLVLAYLRHRKNDLVLMF